MVYIYCIYTHIIICNNVDYKNIPSYNILILLLITLIVRLLFELAIFNSPYITQLHIYFPSFWGLVF